MKRAIHIFSCAALILVPVESGAFAGSKVKYAKTEVEKAAGKCVGSLLGGVLLGALVGSAVDGKKGTARGALAGAAVGGVICAVLMSNAKKKDRIIAAQMEAATHQGRDYVTYFPDDEGGETRFSGRAGATQTIDAARLQPVRYQLPGGDKAASPVLGEGGQECRLVSSTLQSGGNRGTLPNQMTCRTPEGDWEPYGLKST